MRAAWAGRNSSGSWPAGTFGISKSVKHPAVEAAQDVAHEIDRAVVLEIDSVNCPATDFWREKAGTIDVPDIVRWRRRFCQRRAI
jgi:hypothetical protein